MICLVTQIHIDVMNGYQSSEGADLGQTYTLLSTTDLQVKIILHGPLRRYRYNLHNSVAVLFCFVLLIDVLVRSAITNIP